MQLKTKLEATANVILILAALAIGYVLIKERVSGSHVPRYVAAGVRLGPLPDIDWSRHRQTLVLALNTGCHFCEQSVPFYQKLSGAQQLIGDGFEVVAVFPNDAEVVRQFMIHEDLRIRSVSAVAPDKLRVDATPTIILVNSSGHVERSWVGTLTSREEFDVLNSVTKGQSKN